MISTTPARSRENVSAHQNERGILANKTIADIVVASSEASTDNGSHAEHASLVPLRIKLVSILLVTAGGFGSHWSSGVTGAMKSTLKKVSCRSLVRVGQSRINRDGCRNCI